LKSVRNLKGYIYASLISLLAGMGIFASWYENLLPTGFGYLPWLALPNSLSTLQTEISASIIVFVSLAMGISVKRFGVRKCWHFLLLGFGILFIVSFLTAHFLGIDLLPLPMCLAGLLSLVLVQVHSLWQLDRQLSKTLLTAPRGSGLGKTEDAKARLSSGLKLLQAVLPVKEAVVFQCAADNEFQTVTRLKTGADVLTDQSRNSVWRDGVKLCRQAVDSGELVVQTSENGATSNVAVPLKHEYEIVGSLLLRFTQSFCDDDRPLLEAVGSQFARNLARDSFSKNSFANSVFGFFSTVGSEKKIDALQVLRAVTTERRCEANALASIDDGVAIAYLDGTIAMANPTLLGIAEITNEQLSDFDVFSLLDKFRTGVFDEPAIAVRRVLQTGLDYEGELNFDQRNQILGLRIALLRETSHYLKEPLGLAIFVRDLTKIKEYEKLKSDMISLMSHELRTPLTSINGFAELLTVDSSIPEQAREFVTIIANESQRMSRMINTFLAVTQLQRKDKQEVLKIPLRLDEVVRDTIATLQPVAKKKRIRVVEQPAHRVPPVAADKSLITQVVKNLLHNAIKYSPERTTVTISTALEAESVRVSVEDRGFGIPAESKDRVWEKFYRVVREGQEKDEESTGLGLSFVREVVEQHGGSVALDSEEGRGSKFSFTLPRL